MAAKKITVEQARQALYVGDITQEFVKKGGFYFDVHAYRGRFHDTHRIVGNAKGQLFCVDHGMASIHALYVEAKLCKDAQLMGKKGAFPDACYAIADILFNPASTSYYPIRAHHEMFGNRGSYTSYPDDFRDLTGLECQWFSVEAHQFLGRVISKRAWRGAAHRPAPNPQVSGIPFPLSYEARTNYLVDELRYKIDRVQKKLRPLQLK